MSFVGSTRGLLIFGLCVSVAWGQSGFLYVRRNAISRLLNSSNVKEELDGVLTEALGLGHGLSAAVQEAKTQEILPMFESRPKNVHGRISRDAMQYMVQRYFGHEHGWSIKGFDPASTANVSLGKELTDMLVYGFDAERRNRTDFPITMQKIRNGYPQGWPSGVYGVSTMMAELKGRENNNRFEGYSGGYPVEVA